MRVVLFAITCISLSCRESEVTLPGTPYQPPNDLRSVIPLQVGDQWIYFYDNSNPLGVSFSDTVTRVVLDSTVMNGQLYYSIREDWKFLGESRTFQESVDRFSYQSCFHLLYNNACDSLRSYPLRLPLVAGDHWPSVFAGGRVIGESRITTTDTGVTVNGSRYVHAIVVRDSLFDPSASDIPVFREIEPQVGIVKEYGGNETMELISWNPHAR